MFDQMAMLRHKFLLFRAQWGQRALKRGFIAGAPEFSFLEGGRLGIPCIMIVCIWQFFSEESGMVSITLLLGILSSFPVDLPGSVT